MSRAALGWSSAAVVLLVSAAVAAWAMAPRPMPESPAPAFDLARQPADVVAAYEFVDRHAELVSHIPCYCGCGKSLGHGSLRDCYLKRDGSGYEAHASVCYVCLEEAGDIEQLVAAGEGLSAIRAWIDKEYSRFGPPTSTP